MEKDEEYELMPHNEIIELRKELDKLKKNPLGKGKSAENLLDAISTLNDSINSLIYVFQHATESLKEEQYHKTERDDTDIHPLITKMNQLIDQNKEIAEGIVSVAEIVKREKKEIHNFEDRIKPFSRKFEGREPIPPRHSAPAPRPVFANSSGPINMTPPPGNPNPMPNFGQGSNIPPMGGGFNPPRPEQHTPSGMPPPSFSGPSNLNLPPIQEEPKPEKKKGFLSFGK